MTATTATPGSLLDLHRAGRLAADYPQVRARLSVAPEAEFQRAGQLLARLDPEEVLRAHPQVPLVRVAVTGHGNLAMLVPPLTAELARHGVLLRPTVTDFDSYVAELSDPAGELHASRPDLVLCVLDPMMVLDDLPTPWDLDAVRTAVDHRIALIEGLAEQFVVHSEATLVLNTLPLLRRFTAQLVDYRSRARLGALWREAGARLLRLGERSPQVVVLDLDPLLAEGVPASDPRLSTYAGAHLSAPLLAAYAKEAAHLVRHLQGRTKKCLAVDLDETLWGGVLSEDGFEGIEIGEGLRGKAFTAFQRAVRQLAAQGVLLTAVSKNDLEPVREVLRSHPGMTLREDDFVRVRADWQAKPGHLREIAAAIGIGLDSFVFVDDSPHECGVVREHCPEVDVVPLDAEPALHVEKLLADGWFNVREVTAEDGERTAMYRADAARGELRTAHASLDGYLADLGITVTLAPAEPGEIQRISQLTLRTNQFNLTTERLQPADVQDRIDDPTRTVLSVRVGDRFGDSGLTGAVFLRQSGEVLTVENFLLSCRVLARGVEGACLAAVLRQAEAQGVRVVEAEYRATAKNAKVARLYPDHGFRETGGDGATTAYRHVLEELPAVPGHIRLIDRTESADRPEKEGR
ncbi:HAD-IIIC family phosphatase [Kitasatospora sp. NPDC127116]|uniref:HAD-IIIC family phosphatase n=1 Tax=Kitasatospora sp. NPDC127116 TaxID=3345367 RepID=UPI00362CA1AF